MFARSDSLALPRWLVLGLLLLSLLVHLIVIKWAKDELALPLFPIPDDALATIEVQFQTPPPATKPLPSALVRKPVPTVDVNPDDIAEYGVPKIFLAGVGELMTEVAGEVCDGFICHGFTTEKYLREVTLPALARGRAKAGKTMEGFEIVGPSFVVTGNNDEELEAAAAGTRQQIAFYGSTPAYRGVLDIHGWGGLQDELNSLSKAGKWVEMGNVINDEILNTFAVVGKPETIASELGRRYSDVIQRISFYAPYKSDPERWSQVIADLKSA